MTEDNRDTRIGYVHHMSWSPAHGFLVRANIDGVHEDDTGGMLLDASDEFLRGVTANARYDQVPLAEMDEHVKHHVIMVDLNMPDDYDGPAEGIALGFHRVNGHTAKVDPDTPPAKSD